MQELVYSFPYQSANPCSGGSVSYHHLPEYRALVKRLALKFAKIPASTHETPCLIDTHDGAFPATLLMQGHYSLNGRAILARYVWCEVLEPRRFLFVGSETDEVVYEIRIPTPKSRKGLTYERNYDVVLLLNTPEEAPAEESMQPPGYVAPKVFTLTHMLQPVVVHGPEWFEPLEVELLSEDFPTESPAWRVRTRQGLEGIYTGGYISWPGTERLPRRAELHAVTSPDSKGKKFDGGKLRFSLFPQFVMRPVLEILEEGAKEYGENNWQKVEDARRRYYDALNRHLTSWWEGETIDKKSGKPHMAHIICNAAFLLWFERTAEDRTQGDKT